MTTILHVASSSNLTSSNTRQIGNLLTHSLAEQNPETKVITRDLVTHPIPHISAEMLGAMFGAAPDTPLLQLSNQLIDELFSSDLIIVEAPMYNFGLPSVLKAWIDHIARAGKTFHYTANGPEGLLKNKKLILVLARGGIYSDGPFKAYEHQETYLRSIFGFLGITDVQAIIIEGIALGADKAAEALANAKDQVTSLKLAA